MTHTFVWLFYIFAKYIMKYRKDVITQNLINSLHADQSEVKKIRNKFYSHWRKHLIQIFDIIAFNQTRVLEHIECDTSAVENSKGGIILAAHFGNWEQNIIALPLFLHQKIVGFYKPLKNAVMNETMIHVRSKFGLELLPMEKVAREVTSYPTEHKFYVFLADQSPVNLNGVHWNQFLTQKTPWLIGSEKMAKKYKMPVYYLHQEPKDNGQYKMSLSKITDDASLEPDNYIIETYSQLLQKDILRNPSYWLWSHRRWKRAK